MKRAQVLQNQYLVDLGPRQRRQKLDEIFIIIYFYFASERVASSNKVIKYKCRTHKDLELIIDFLSTNALEYELEF